MYNSNFEQKVTIVMYHMIRNKQNIMDLRIKTLLTNEFIKQLDYMDRNYSFITIQDCINALYYGSKLPANPILLTFDDGYIEHYRTVFPILNERGIQGCFYPVPSVIFEKSILDVNKIQLILWNANIEDVTNHIKQLIEKYKDLYNLKSWEFYKNNISYYHPYDTKDVIAIKALLQTVLDQEVRKVFIESLFLRYIAYSESSIFKELYMTEEHIMELINNGMHIGSHGYSHVWMNKISPNQQDKELEKSLKFMKKIGVPSDEFTMCYPYGGYNNSLINKIRFAGFKVAFTTKEQTALLVKKNAFMLERIDTKEIIQLSDNHNINN